MDNLFCLLEPWELHPITVHFPIAFLLRVQSYCFGRYGGYGAGFATGLLGFLQVYWDPNRQAIQDKISATVVIKGSMNQPVTPKTIEKAIKE